ncbi:MAG TPA: peptidylprolyl isomerase [Vicinamibacterales bacterium]|nr:peptidylprolyl isomerase [Vicinamibacterales bacterium]
MNRLFAAVVVAAALGLPARAEIVERVLVKVNGQILTKTQLEERQILALRQKNPQLREEDVRNDEQLKKMLADVTPDILVDAIDEMLLLQRGRELGYRLSDEQFTQILANIKKENRLESEEQFNAALKQEGMTLQQLRDSIERRMVIDRVQQVEVMQKISITEEDARKYYDAHPQEFTTSAQVTLREILITIPETTTPTGEKAVSVASAEATESRVNEIRDRVTKGGEDFGRVASEVSDAPSKANGGLIGPIAPTELAPELQERLAKMKPGEVTEPIRTPRGFQLLKLESATAALRQPFEEVRDKIADAVYNQKRRGEVEKYLRRVRSEAIIEWKSEELRQLYEQKMKELQAAAPSGSAS